MARTAIGMSISSDRKELALAAEFPVIEIINLLKPHEPRRALRGLSNRVGTVAFSPVGPRLAVAGHGAGGLIDVQSGRVLDLFDDKVNMSPFALAFGPGGDRLAMAVGDEVHVIRLAISLTGKTLAASLGPIRRLAVSPDERLIAVGRDDGTIVVWDVCADRVCQKLSGHALALNGLAFVPRPEGPWLASVGGDGLVQIWDPEVGGQPLRTLNGQAGAVYSVAVRNDGRQLAAGGEDGMVRTWDPATGRADLGPLDHGALVSALAYNRTGTALASGGMDRTARVWSTTSGRRLLEPLIHKHQLTSLAFSPDGELLAGGGGAKDKGGTIGIWNASSGAILMTIDCPRGAESVSFSSDGRRIATCGSDDVVQIWDATGGHETLSLHGHTDRVSSVLFAPTDLRLYSVGRDGVVKLWDGSSRNSGE